MKHIKHQQDPFTGLTEDLINEILFRLPLKSLGKCKLVSKQWNSLISDPEFAISHLNFSIQNNQPLTLASQKHNIISTLEFEDAYDITQGVLLAPVENQFPADECDDYYCFMIGSCHGLVCIYLKPTQQRICGDLMFIWNPTTDEREEIALPDENAKTLLLDDACWFGYIDSIDDYKVVLVYFVGKPVIKERMYVYSLRKSRWNEIRVTNELGSSFFLGSNSVLMEEALHCLCDGNKWICKFDLVAESFENIPFLINEPELIKESRQAFLGYIGEDDCLCVMFVQYPVVKVVNSDSEEDSSDEESEEEERALELWVLEDYNQWDTWKKLYRLDLPKQIFSSPIKVLGFTYNGIVCIQAEDGLKLFDPSDDPPTYANVRNPNYAKVYKVMDYVESLVSPFDLP